MDNDRILLFSLKSPFVLLPSIVFDLSRIPGATRYSIARLVVAFAHLYALSSSSKGGRISLSYQELQKVLSLESKAKVHSILAFLKERKVLGGKLADGFLTYVYLPSLPLLPKVLSKALPSSDMANCFFAYPVFTTILPIEVYAKAVYLYLLSLWQSSCVPLELSFQKVKEILKVRKRQLTESLKLLNEWNLVKVQILDSGFLLSDLSFRWSKELIKKSYEMYPGHIFFQVFGGKNAR